MVDVFQKEGMLLGLRGYSGPYNFNSYEKYLYDQLRFLQSSQGIKIPAFRPTDDVEKLSRAIRRAEIKELPDPLQNNLDAHTCNHTTHRCHHAAHAYTGIPCAAYIGYKKKKSLTANNNNNNNNNKQVSLPKIPGTQTGGSAGGGSPLGGSTAQGLEGGIGGRVRQGEPVGLRNYDPRNPLTVELQHGQARQQIVLPTDLLDKNKKYHLTFTIKVRPPRNEHTCMDHRTCTCLTNPPVRQTTKIKEQTSLETDPNEQVSSAPEILPSDPARQESLAMDSLASESQQESQSAALEAGTEA
ncbi:hypothetical protein O3P69_001165 [Scylla paramamosain]|uniref:Uncharacterized protein n=1 Tax=Scylla paramamosain TaxID=85552 RepID=A0AAW0UP05_SCYPA